MKPNEQKILGYFNEHSDNEQSTSEIQIAVGISQANCSRYLNNMVSMKILSKRKVGRQTFYSLFGKDVNLHTYIHTSEKSNITKVTKSNDVTTEKEENFDLQKYESEMNNLLGMNDTNKDIDPELKSLVDIIPDPSKQQIELPLLLLTEVLDDIRSRKVKGFNLAKKKLNDKPYREVFETTLRLIKEKIK